MWYNYKTSHSNTKVSIQGRLPRRARSSQWHISPVILSKTNEMSEVEVSLECWFVPIHSLRDSSISLRSTRNDKYSTNNSPCMHQEIITYNESQLPEDKQICDFLLQLILWELPDAKYKIWHRHPVWFLEGNPIVGYHKLKDCVRLLFWSGQSFEEEGLKSEWSFKAAEKRYTWVEQINVKDVKKWLKKGREVQWDYKNIVKNKGKLGRLK